MYEGQVKNNKANGEGTFKQKNGQFFIGKWINDLQEGDGVETLDDGSTYTGQFRRGKKHG